MQKLKIKDAPISSTHLSTFRRILKAKKIRAKKKQTYHQEITFKNNYYLDMMKILREAQVLANESLTFRMKSNIGRH